MMTILYFQEGTGGRPPVSFFREGKVAIAVGDKRPKAGETWVVEIVAELDRKFEVRLLQFVSATLPPFPVQMSHGDNNRNTFWDQSLWGLSSERDRRAPVDTSRGGGHNAWYSLARLLERYPAQLLGDQTRGHGVYLAIGGRIFNAGSLEPAAIEAFNTIAGEEIAEREAKKAAEEAAEKAKREAEMARRPACPLCGEKRLVSDSENWVTFHPRRPQRSLKCQGCEAVFGLFRATAGEFIVDHGDLYTPPTVNSRLFRIDREGVWYVYNEYNTAAWKVTPHVHFAPEAFQTLEVPTLSFEGRTSYDFEAVCQEVWKQQQARAALKQRWLDTVFSQFRCPECDKMVDPFATEGPLNGPRRCQHRGDRRPFGSNRVVASVRFRHPTKGEVEFELNYTAARNGQDWWLYWSQPKIDWETMPEPSAVTQIELPTWPKKEG